MNRSLIISSVLHCTLIFITAMSLPFLAKKPIDIPPIVSVELIQIAEKTNIPFAPKAKKIIEKKKKKKLKEKEKKLVSEQAPPKKVKKSKTKTVVSLDSQKEKVDNQKYFRSINKSLTNHTIQQFQSPIQMSHFFFIGSKNG